MSTGPQGEPEGRTAVQIPGFGLEPTSVSGQREILPSELDKVAPCGAQKVTKIVLAKIFGAEEDYPPAKSSPGIEHGAHAYLAAPSTSPGVFIQLGWARGSARGAQVN